MQWAHQVTEVRVLTIKRKRKPLLTPLLGPSFSYIEIKKLLDQTRIKYVKDDKIEKTVAKLINDGKTIGWCQGR